MTSADDSHIHLKNLNVELIDEVFADRLVNNDVPLYKRLRLIKDLVESGADLNYIDDTHADTINKTTLECAFLGKQILHITLLIHLGAKMTAREIDAMNNTFGISNIMCLLRICPNLRKFYSYAIFDESEASNSLFMDSVDNWINHKNFQLKKDPEILSILFNQANIDITPYLQYFNKLLPDACLAALEERFGPDLYIRVWMSTKPFIDNVSWKTRQCTIGVYSKPDRMANSMIQLGSSSEHCHSNKAAMYDATVKVLSYDTPQKKRTQKLPQ